MKDFPTWIEFVSDNSQVELVQEITDAKLKDRIANYKFIKSNNNLHKVFPLGIKQISNLYDSNLILCR
jgi:hypothetical protein